MFKSKFCSQRTTVALIKEMLALKKEKKEKVQDFRHRFSTHLKNFSAAIKPTEKTLIEYYTSTLCLDMVMFAKRSVKASLAGTYEEAEKIEAELESVNKYLGEAETKTFSNNKPLLLTRPKDERSNELEGVVKMV